MKDYFYCTIDGFRNSEAGSRLNTFFHNLPHKSKDLLLINVLRDKFLAGMKVPINVHEVRFCNMYMADNVKPDNLYYKLAETDFSMLVPGSQLWGICDDQAFLVIVGRKYNNVVFRFWINHRGEPAAVTDFIRVAVGRQLMPFVEGTAVYLPDVAMRLLNLIPDIEAYSRQPSAYLGAQERKTA